jgi:hypothetical protein
MERHAYRDDAGLEQQPAFHEERGLIVEDLVPAFGDDEFRQHYGHDSV